MKKSKKIQALKKQLIHDELQLIQEKPIQNSNVIDKVKSNTNSKDSIETSKNKTWKFPKIFKTASVDSPISTTKTNYTIEKNPYILGDLKKVLIISIGAFLILFILYFFRTNPILKNFADWIYNFLHLS